MKVIPKRVDSVMDLEHLLSSACRRKIIKALAENGELNVMKLILKIRGKYPQVNASLQILQKEGIVLDRHYGRIRLIKLNRENSNTKLLLEALKILDSNRLEKVAVGIV
jgi:DNA-binding transcriptional ArsR family regulator